MKSFREYFTERDHILFSEGVWDKSQFKCVFALGGGAAGKSKTAGLFRGMGFKVLQSDDLFELFMGGMRGPDGGQTPGDTPEKAKTSSTLGLPNWTMEELPHRWYRGTASGSKTKYEMTPLDDAQKDKSAGRYYQSRPASDGWKPFRGYSYGPGANRGVADELDVTKYPTQSKAILRAIGLNDFRSGQGRIKKKDQIILPYDQGFTLKRQGDSEEQSAKYAQMKGDQFSGGIYPRTGIPILVEATGASDALDWRVNALRQYGYDTYGILVWTDPVVALVNNQIRGLLGGRPLNEDLVWQVHIEVKKNAPRLRNLFGNMLYVVSTTRQIPSDWNKDNYKAKMQEWAEQYSGGRFDVKAFSKMYPMAGDEEIAAIAREIVSQPLINEKGQKLADMMRSDYMAGAQPGTDEKMPPINKGQFDRRIGDTSSVPDDYGVSPVRDLPSPEEIAAQRAERRRRKYGA